MQVVYQWARGTAFTDICQLTDVMEARCFCDPSIICLKSLACCASHAAMWSKGSDSGRSTPARCDTLAQANWCAHTTSSGAMNTLRCGSSQGSIVRTVVRLDETCREFRDAARVMGDTALWAQMTAASAAIKRDVVFAASLYVA